MKTAVIINGVTGAIGSAALARFTREKDTVVYGLSRQALPFPVFTTDGMLPARTLVCSMGDSIDEGACAAFVSSLPIVSFNRIIYVHAVGVYPFELDSAGRIVISNDENGDGVDDRVTKLSHDAFFAMTDSLARVGVITDAFILGGIADKYRPAVHTSWWKTMERVKHDMQERVASGSDVSFHVLNISSVICPHELLSRPYVFQDTNADPRFWLTPDEVAREVVSSLGISKDGAYTEQDLFHPSDYYYKDYFVDEHFTERKVAELGLRRRYTSKY